MWFKKNVFSIICVLTIAILFYKLYTTSQNEGYLEDYNNKIKVLESKVDSLHSVNSGLGCKIDTLNQQVNKLDLQIGLRNSRISNLKYRINEKVNTVDSFSNSELEKFFTDRYNKSISRGTDSTLSN